jgi:hypothetical protein
MNNNNNNLIQFNSIIYYLCAESTATRPITNTAQCSYRQLHNGQTQHKVKGTLQTNKQMKMTNTNSVALNPQANYTD